MRQYYIKVEDKKLLSELNNTIIEDSLFTIGESFAKDQLLIGHNFTDEERVFKSVLKYQVEKQLFYYPNFEVCDITHFFRLGAKIELSEDSIIVDGFKMKIKPKRGYTYALRKTFVGSQDVEQLAKILVQDFWRANAEVIIDHVRTYGKQIA